MLTDINKKKYRKPNVKEIQNRFAVINIPDANGQMAPHLVNFIIKVYDKNDPNNKSGKDGLFLYTFGVTRLDDIKFF